MQYIFGQLVSTVLTVFPHNLLPTPGLLSRVDRVRSKEGLDTVQALFVKS